MKAGVVKILLTGIKRGTSKMDLMGFTTEKEYYVDDKYNLVPEEGIRKGTLVSIDPEGKVNGRTDATMVIAQPTEALRAFGVLTSPSKVPNTAGYPMNKITGRMEDNEIRFPFGRFENTPLPLVYDGVFYAKGVKATGEIVDQPFTPQDIFKRVYQGKDGTVVPYAPKGAGLLSQVVGHIVDHGIHSKVRIQLDQTKQEDVIEI